MEAIQKHPSFLETRSSNIMSAVDMAVYLFHFPLIEYATWALGTPAQNPCPGWVLNASGTCENREPFQSAGHNWGANDPMPWWACILVFISVILLGWPITKFVDDPLNKILRSPNTQQHAARELTAVGPASSSPLMSAAPVEGQQPTIPCP